MSEEATPRTQYSRSEEQEIASDQLDDLADNPDRCASISVRTGRHPWVVYSPTYDTHLIAETGGVGRLEVDTADKAALTDLFAENPVDIIPKTEAMFSPREPGRENVWEYFEARGENVLLADPMLAEDDQEPVTDGGDVEFCEHGRSIVVGCTQCGRAWGEHDD